MDTQPGESNSGHHFDPNEETAPSESGQGSIRAIQGTPPKDAAAPSELKRASRDVNVQAGDLLRGRYRLLRLIGQGGMGSVWEATDEHLNESVAIKLLRPDYATNTEFLETFREEAKACLKLAHPKIVRLRNTERDTDRGISLFLVMDFIKGESLSERLKSAPNGLPISEVLDIARDIAEAIDYAHSQSVIHRDIKPANIMLDHTNERALLSDFGISRTFENHLSSLLSDKTSTGGTPYYMSPQQFEGKDSRRNDIYSFAATLYEALSGQRPFTGTLDEIKYKVRNEAAHPIHGIPQPIWDAIQAGLKKDDRARPNHATSMIEMMNTEPVSPISRQTTSTHDPTTGHVVNPTGGFITPLKVGVAVLLVLIGALTVGAIAAKGDLDTVAKWFNGSNDVAINPSSDEDDDQQNKTPKPAANGTAGSTEQNQTSKQLATGPMSPLALSVVKPLPQNFISIANIDDKLDKPVQEMSDQELRDTVETLREEQHAITEAWARIIESHLAETDPPDDSWHRWPTPFHSFELKQLNLYEYEDVGIIGLSGSVLTQAEKDRLVGRLVLFDAVFNTDEITVAPQPLADRVEEDLKRAGVENVKVLVAQTDSGTRLKVQFDRSPTHTEQSVVNLTSRYVFDPYLIDVQAF